MLLKIVARGARRTTLRLKANGARSVYIKLRAGRTVVRYVVLRVGASHTITVRNARGTSRVRLYTQGWFG